ncbi:Holliday junction ATP-dependent DNA helicase [Candidatus Photodesmus blepharus]|uniref:Holliday junction branch migration complex subunit RuvA n=1 Tax=Candidatus Photodesmus blepharonis TaxID=1179155 RepID=A0A084CP96_9GAMM|nr:Holliday junction ATP-dependent DNA helicase [Candidatus Photodesmus blepharus]
MGLLVEKQPPELLIEVNGVGYEVQMPISCFCKLPSVGKKVAIYTHFIVREDAQLLYGFNTIKERALFRELIKVNGVGPKLALSILYSMTASQFVSCIKEGDVSTLIKLPGVGTKTAERLIIEMKDRLKIWNTDLFTSKMDVTSCDSNLTPVSSNVKEAISALLALGYKPTQALKIISKIAKPDMTSENLIREALKAMV